MSSTSGGGGAAYSATVAIEDGNTPTAAPFAEPQRTVAQQQYLDDVADAAERAVAHVEQTITDLQESLAERRAEAERARAEADNGRVDSEGGA